MADDERDPHDAEASADAHETPEADASADDTTEFAHDENPSDDEVREPGDDRAHASAGAGTGAGAGVAAVRRTPGQVVLSVLKWFGIVVLALAVLGVGTFAAVYATTPIPDPNRDFQTNVSTVYYRDGKEQMGTFVVQNRESIPYSEMPDTVTQSVVANENETFWTDSGISIPGMARAVVSALGPGDTIGGSTITQQYVKVLYLTQDKTITRKLTEIIIALKVGQDLPKEKILEGYLNTVYFGRGAYGIQAAAKSYFGVDAKDLNLQQGISLASIINSPNNLDPARGEKQAADLLERYQYTINQMVKLGHMTEAQKGEIYTTLPEFPKLQTDSRFGGPKGHLLQMVQDELKRAGFSEDQVNGGGLQIVTTVDQRLQDAAVKAAQGLRSRIASAQRQDPLHYHAALASTDTQTGAILALYGGQDYTSDFRNWATTPRPTGSTFKPWALVAGLRDGATLSDRFNGNEFTPRGERRPITNAGGTDYGPVTLEKATTSSINSAYVDMVMQMRDGPAKVAKAAEDAGITTAPKDPRQLVPSIPLGFAEVSPLDASRGLATLVNEGKRSNPHIVAEVKNLRGETLYQAPVAAEQAIEPNVARNAVHALTGVVEDGTARSVAALGHQIAGKTGTYYDSERRETKATWFIGSTKQISTAVMLVAGDQGTGNLGRTVYGSTYTAPGWLEYMRVAMSGLPKERFPGPVRQRGSGRFSAPPAPAPRPTTNAPATTRAPATSASAAPSTSQPPTSAPPSSEPTTSAPQPTTQAPTQAPTREPAPSASAPPTTRAGASTRPTGRENSPDPGTRP